MANVGLRRYAGPIALVFAVGQGSYAGHLYFDHQRLSADGVVTAGRIVETRIDRNRQGQGTDAHASVSFAASGQAAAVRRTEVPVATAENLQGKSDVPVRVRYLPTNPDTFEIVGESSTWGVHALMAGVLGLLGIILTLRGSRT